MNCYWEQAYKITDVCRDIEELYIGAVDEFKDIMFLDDMNAWNSEFWNKDVTNVEGWALPSVRLGSTEFIKKLIRIVNSIKSCTDLILYDKPLMVVEIDVGCKIAEICDHCLIYVLLQFNIHKPKCYKHLTWNFKNDDFD